MKNPSMFRGLCLGAAMALVAAPAFAQEYPDEIIVTGQVPDSVRTLSQPVHYGDLDLASFSGMEELRNRVRSTARSLCQALGESDTASAPIRSCPEDAYRGAMSRLGTWREGYAPRGTTWVAARE